MTTMVIGRKSYVTLLLCGGLLSLDASAAIEGGNYAGRRT